MCRLQLPAARTCPTCRLVVAITSFSMSNSRDYSSQSYSPGSAGPAKSVDTKGKYREKDDMVGLNDKFVQLIDKVKDLEDENKKLKTKLKILKEYEEYKGKVDDIVKQEENELEQQIENLLHDQEKLHAELFNNRKEKEDTKKSYEEELQKKLDLESTFILVKKEVDKSHLDSVEMVLELEELLGQIDFLRDGYDEEIKELESQVQNKTVTIRENGKRSLDMDDIVENVKIQYANMASRSREEAERWHKRKMDDLVFKADQREQDVRDMKRETSDLVRQIQRLTGELDALKRKEDSLKKEINDVRTEGDENLNKGRNDIAQLEDALRQAKQELAKQIREYQELMNIKLALDIEIATYHKLLEGEEERIKDFVPRYADVHPPSKQHLPSKPEKPREAPENTIVPLTTIIPADAVIPPVYPVSKKRLLIRVQVQSGKVVSESSCYTED